MASQDGAGGPGANCYRLLQLDVDKPLVNFDRRRYYPPRVTSKDPPVRSRFNFFPDTSRFSARKRFLHFALDILGLIVDIDRTLAPSGAASAEPKLSWISPAVLDLGGMRDLTLLQASGVGDCDFNDPDCEL